MSKLMVCVLGIAVFAGGCTTSTMSKQELEKVAKDWCLTIRASQVMPVYPLTEDLQPGDVFLVQTPITEQAEIYSDRGFLPLDYQIARLGNVDYASFYQAGYFKGDYASTPHSRPAVETGDGEDPRRFRTAPLPMAAFPSYTFAVQRGLGIRIALPVKGIPVGLGLMNTESATGTVTIADGMTCGVDSEFMLRRLVKWINEDAKRKAVLGAIRSNGDKPVYLRVVTRVYLIGSVEQLVRALGGKSKYHRFQTVLTIGNDDMDDASQSNLRLLRLLAQSLIRSKKSVLDELAGILKSHKVVI